MGTTWSVVYTDSTLITDEQLMALIESELADINRSLSTYLPESEISRINRGETATTERLSDDFSDVLTTALAIHELTGGAYDVTIGPLVDLWGFGPEPFSGTVPPAAAIARARALVGAGRINWQPASQRLQLPEGMRVDMSSIAKGYAVDQLVELLLAQGIDSVLVEIGGELRAHGERPEGGPWRLAIESPEPASGRFLTGLRVSEGAVATSGDYRNFFEIDGKRYSHLVDPRTGAPVDHELVSVTVVHKLCAVADALATGLLVMGLESAFALAEEEGLAAYFVTSSEAGLAVHSTPEFKHYADFQS